MNDKVGHETTFHELGLIHKLEEEFEAKLRQLEQQQHESLKFEALRLEDRIKQLERKRDETAEKSKSFNDKLEKKVKEVVEQNVSIKIQLDSFKTKQVQTDRQLSLLLSQPHVGVEFNDLQKQCDEMLHQARAEISRALQEIGSN